MLLDSKLKDSLFYISHISLPAAIPRSFAVIGSRLCLCYFHEDGDYFDTSSSVFPVGDVSIQSVAVVIRQSRLVQGGDAHFASVCQFL